ncbi:MAG: phosphate ABC transporter substrate-binding protein [Syntrophobacteria bacterium]
MFSKSPIRKNMLLLGCLVLAYSILLIGCGQKSEETSTSSSRKTVIQNSGSDTMVNLAQTWAEEYATINPSVSVEVSGGGSGTGIAALINGTVDIANCSRQMEPEEMERAKQNTGKEPQKFVVGYDALAVYIHKDNPLNEISIEQLAQIYGEGGKITKWSQLGIKNPACDSDEIIRVSRQSNSGTYHYFRETLLGKERDFKLGSRDLHGSKDVVELVGRTPCAIGYSGMGYATEQVKKLKIFREAGKPAYEPSLKTALDGTYPISRPLYMYSLGEPTGEIRKYLQWIYSDVGQGIVEQSGYVPLPQEERVMAPK